MRNLFRQGRALLLDSTRFGEAFNERSADPQFLLDLALEGEYSGLIVAPGIAEQYWRGAYRDVNLIIKLDREVAGATVQTCTVERALKLGAAAVTLSLREERESFALAGAVAEAAHDHNLPLLIETSGARLVRAALELGADSIITAPSEELSLLRKLAGRSDLLVTSGARDATALLEQAHALNGAESAGLVVGLNVAEHEKPFSLSKALGEIIYRRRRPEQVAHLLQNV